MDKGSSSVSTSIDPNSITTAESEKDIEKLLADYTESLTGGTAEPSSDPVSEKISFSASEELTYFPPNDTFRIAASNSSGALCFVKYPEAPALQWIQEASPVRPTLHGWRPAN